MPTKEAMDIALVIPMSGNAGLFGPSCEMCARLAVEELNAKSGILGKELSLILVDGSRPADQVAEKVNALVSAGMAQAVVGWHISTVRQALTPEIAGRVPYVYTALYEGGETTPGVFLVGEVPSRQLLPAMAWLAREHHVKRWCIVGNDYVWPRRSAVHARRYARQLGGKICRELYVPLGTRDYAQALRRVEESAADAVLMLLLGQDAVDFNRAFAKAGLDAECLRLSTLMDENMVLATGSGNSRGLSASAAYFESLATPEGLDFGLRFTQRFGPHAPTINSVGESCYEGIMLLSALAEQAKTLDTRSMTAASDSVGYAGPRGEVRLRDRHLDQRVYLAAADGLDFRVLGELPPVSLTR